MVHQHHPALTSPLARALAGAPGILALLVACTASKGEAPTPVVASPAAPAGPLTCPEEMVLIDAYCIDRFEAGLEGRSPFVAMKRDERPPRAVCKKDVVPQGYISKDEASIACSLAGKRLCRAAEWVKACKGPQGTKWPYGNERRPKVCNDSGVQCIARMPESRRAMTWDNMNDPRLNQMSDTVMKTGSLSECVSGYGVFDMVGNLHEWVEEGSFHGGYYLDVVIMGDGCEYKTTAHESWYHDYSTGFRCCADAKR
jgi:sulfatase modifying factor 1